MCWTAYASNEFVCETPYQETGQLIVNTQVLNGVVRVHMTDYELVL